MIESSNDILYKESESVRRTFLITFSGYLIFASILLAWQFILLNAMETALASLEEGQNLISLTPNLLRNLQILFIVLLSSTALYLILSIFGYLRFKLNALHSIFAIGIINALALILYMVILIWIQNSNFA